MPETTVTTGRALARTDSAAGAAAGGRAAPTGAAPLSARTARRLGAGLTAGTLAWAASTFVFPPTADGIGGRIGDLTGLAFQLGVFCLLTVMIRTQATGTSRFARGMLRVECGLLGLAASWSLLHGVLPAGMQDATWLAVLDVFWPLSMLGMFVIGIKVAAAGRWTGAVRAWPVVAETWGVITVPMFLLLGPVVSQYVGAVHLVLGYAALGLLIAAMPERTGAR